jgi:hypothetical protein
MLLLSLMHMLSFMLVDAFMLMHVVGVHRFQFLFFFLHVNVIPQLFDVPHRVLLLQVPNFVCSLQVPSWI